MADSKKSMDTYQIIKAIHQAAADCYDRLNKEDFSVGLEREKGIHWKDERVMDGFNVTISGNILKIGYHTQTNLEEVKKGLPKRLEGVFSNIVKYLQKKFKEETSTSLRLEDKGDIKIHVEVISAKRGWANASKLFKIKNLQDFAPEEKKNQDEK